MDDATSYWLPLCAVVQRLRPCWVRTAWRDGDSTDEGRWGQLLTTPVNGYLEGPDGPWPVRVIEWVEVSTSGVKGGLAGRPLQFVDRKAEIIAAANETPLHWELRATNWTVERVFDNEPVDVLRFRNPFTAP